MGLGGDVGLGWVVIENLDSNNGMSISSRECRGVQGSIIVGGKEL